MLQNKTAVVICIVSLLIMQVDAKAISEKFVDLLDIKTLIIVSIKLEEMCFRISTPSRHTHYRIRRSGGTRLDGHRAGGVYRKRFSLFRRAFLRSLGDDGDGDF